MVHFRLALWSPMFRTSEAIEKSFHSFIVVPFEFTSSNKGRTQTSTNLFDFAAGLFAEEKRHFQSETFAIDARNSLEIPFEERASARVNATLHHRVVDSIYSSMYPSWTHTFTVETGASSPAETTSTTDPSKTVAAACDNDDKCDDR